jgi:hypothetical protein
VRRRLSGLVVLALSGCTALPVTQTTTSTTTTSTTTTSTTTTTTSTTTTTTLPPLLATGRVVDAGGRPIAGVEVVFGDAITTTGPDGAFEAETREAETLSFAKPGWERHEAPYSEGALEVTMTQATIRGVRVGAAAAGSDEHFRSLMALAAQPSVNAFVFDTKQEGGQVVYDTAVAAAHEIGAVEPWYDPRRRVAEAREAGIYTITRIVSLEDAFWAKAHPEEKMAGPWVDPTGPGIRQYIVDLAVEACEIGFDEIQLDYVRYAAGRTASFTGQLNMTQEERVANIAEFIRVVREAVSPLGCNLSADIFGIVVSFQDDQRLGQRPEELSVHLDAVSPMVYPSHYSDGWLGFPDPNDHPYAVTADALDDALPRLAPGTVLRPWLQGFWWTPEQIHEAIRAAEDRGLGWLLWNVGSRYEPASIPAVEETGG